jgi:hypothetical protein
VGRLSRSTLRRLSGWAAIDIFPPNRRALGRLAVGLLTAGRRWQRAAGSNRCGRGWGRVRATEETEAWPWNGGAAEPLLRSTSGGCLPMQPAVWSGPHAIALGLGQAEDERGKADESRGTVERPSR